MSGGQADDWYHTQEQMKKRMPIQNGKNWLRHGEHTQSAEIDLMILEGKYSIKEIAAELNKRFTPMKSLAYRKNRVKDHMDHLKQGSGKDKISGVKGHKLKIEEVDGKVRFKTDYPI